jgi:hypothetical protein
VTSRRLVSSVALASLFVSGCNVIARAQGGPAVVAADDTPYGGAEGNADLFVDMTAGAEALAGQAPPETATRLGVVGGAHVRGTGLGFGVGARSGVFAGSTNADTLVLGTLQAEGGMQTYEGDAYGAVGGVGGFAFGVRVSRTYDDQAILLCRSLTYLTFTAQGMVDYLPSAGVTVPGAALLIGVAALDDAGAPSDRARPEARCPR